MKQLVYHIIVCGMAVLFLTACTVETVGKLTEHTFYLRVIVHTGVDLLHDLCDELTAVLSQFITVFGLYVIYLLQIISEYFPCEG